jgi:hypothetical protein
MKCSISHAASLPEGLLSTQFAVSAPSNFLRTLCPRSLGGLLPPELDTPAALINSGGAFIW